MFHLLAILAPKGHLAFAFMSSALVENAALIEGWDVQMKSNSAVGLASVSHSMETERICKEGSANQRSQF